MSVKDRELQDRSFANSKILEKLLEVNQSLISVRDLDLLLQKVAETAGSVLGADVIVLYEYREEIDDVTVPPVIWGNIQFPEVLREIGRVRPHKESAVFKMLERVEPFYAPNAREDWAQLIEEWPQEEGGAGNFVYREGIASSAAVRLTAEEERVGVLFVNYRAPCVFHDKKRRIIELFATQAAIAIRNARLFNQTQEQVKQLYALVKTAQFINRFTDLESIFEPVFEQAFSLVGKKVGWVALVDRETQILRIVASRGIPQKNIDVFQRRPTYAHEGTFGLVMQTGEIQEFPDAKHDKRVLNLGLPIPEQLTNIPLKVEGQVIGILTLDTLIPNEQARQSLMALVDMTAVAIDKARVFEQNTGLIRSMKQRNEELQALNKIGQAVSAKGVEEVLELVYEQTSQLMDTTNFFISLYNKDKEELNVEIWMHKGRPLEKFSTTASGLTGWVIQERKPLLIRDWDEEEDDFPVQAEIVTERQRSWLGVPLIIGEEVLGVMSVQSPRPGAFDLDTQRLLQIIANQAAVAIENARLLQQERNLALRQTRLTQHSHEVSLLALTGDYDKLADYVAEAVNDLTAASVTLWMLDEKENVLRIQAGRGLRREYMENAITPVEPGRSITSLALRDRCPVSRRNILDKTEEPRFYNMEEAIRQGWRSFLSVPLLGQAGQPLGALSIYYTEPRDFSEPETALLWTFANQAAIAFENVQTMQKLNTQLESLHRVVQEQSLEEVLGRVLEGVNAILGEATSSSINLYEEETGRFEPSVAIGPLQDLLRVSPRPEGTGRFVLSTGEALYLDDVHHPPPGCPTIRDESIAKGIKSFAALPLRRQKQTLGVLFVNLQKPISFSEGIRRILELFASQAAVAIENARLFREREDRAERLVRLQKITATISAGPSDLVKLLKSIVSSLREIFSGASCAIRLYDSKKDEFGPRVAVGVVQDLVDHPPRSEGTSRYIVQTGEPLYIEDVSAAPPKGVPTLRREVLALDIRAAAYLPLRSEGKVIGILYMDLTESRRFSEYDEQILELFASQAAIAIENAQLLRDLAERATQLLQLQEVTAAISAEPPDLEKVLHVIVKSLSGIFREVPCAIRLYDSGTGAFERRVAIGDLDEQLIYVPRPDGATRYVVETRVPLYAEDTTAKLPNGKPVIRKELAKQGLGAVAYLPLLSGESVVGMLYLNLPTPYQFSQNDKQILELFADQAAIAIENARLYEAEQERRHIAETLRQASTVLSSTLELDKVLELILQQLQQVIPYNSASVQRLQGKRLEIVACQGFEEPDKVTGLVFPPLDPKFPNHRVVTKKAPFAIEDVVQDYPHFKGEADRYKSGHIRSWLGVPLMVKDQVIGIITLDRTEVRPYTAKESELAMSFANQAAIAIENAWLFEQLDQRVQELEVLTKIGRTVSNLGIDQILDLVYEQASKIMDLSNAQVQIAFYDEAKDEVSFPLAIEKNAGEKIDVVRWSKREAQYRKPDEDEVVKQFKPRRRREPPGLNEYVIRTKEPLLIVEDFEQKAKAKGIRVWPTFGRLDRPTHSWLGVPMMVGGRVAGVISIQSLEQERAFDRAQQELLTTVANQAAVAIENARLYQRLDEKIIQLEHAQGEIADKERALVLTGVAADFVHRMNNLAGTIPNWVALAKRLLSEDKRGRRIGNYLERIAEDTKVLLREARRLRDPLPEPEDIDMGELIGSIVGQMQLIASPEIDVTFHSEPNLDRVRAVKPQLSDAIFNVIDNGVKAITGEGRVSVTLARDVDYPEEFITIDISDTGCGIPPDRLTAMFELGTSYWPSSEGMGYGLWRARNIIESIGGSICAESEEGAGSTFHITLPTMSVP